MATRAKPGARRSYRPLPPEKPKHKHNDMDGWSRAGEVYAKMWRAARG